MITLQQAKELSKGYRVVPISDEMMADVKTPIEVLKILKGVSNHCYLLESVEAQKQWGRYTFLGFDPTLEITAMDGLVSISRKKKDRYFSGEAEENTEEILSSKGAHPQSIIAQILEEYKSPKAEELPPFTGGLVGYFSYDYAKYSEPGLKLETQDEEGFKDVDLMLFDKVIAYDNLRQKIIIIVNVKTGNLEKEYELAKAEICRIKELIQKGKPKQEPKGRLTSPIRRLFEEEEYCNMVERTKSYIREGDIFQVVLSNRLEADFEGSLLNTYRMLRTTNPSPYMFYFSSRDMEVAGTRPRGKDDKEDRALEQELLEDEKELVEHNNKATNFLRLIAFGLVIV